MGRRPKIKQEEPRQAKIQKFKTPSLVRGVRDILPNEQGYWDLVYKKIGELAKKYNYQKITPPLLEEKSLFQRAIGKYNDLIANEFFCFADPGGNNICLRPEATASVVRAYIRHGMHALPPPVKLYYTGPMFRYERPQSGRQREFYQFGFEALGDKNPILDAQLILIALNFFNELNINVRMQLNSMGCPACRPGYIKEFTKFLKNKKSRLCPECKNLLSRNPLKILNCKEKSCQFVKEESPQIVDWLCEDCKGHFVKVLEYLDDLDVPYELNPHLIRNLDYYTKTIFEIWQEEGADQNNGGNSLGAGGRYDNLVELLDGKPAPACGFAIGIERTIMQLRRQNTVISQQQQPVVFLAQLGEQAKRKCLKLFEELHKNGIYAVESFSTDNLKLQLDIAGKLKVKFTLIMGQKEVLDNTILLRDMDGGMQEIIDFKKVVPEIKKKIEEMKV